MLQFIVSLHPSFLYYSSDTQDLRTNPNVFDTNYTNERIIVAEQAVLGNVLLLLLLDFFCRGAMLFTRYAWKRMGKVNKWSPVRLVEILSLIIFLIWCVVYMVSCLGYMSFLRFICEQCESYSKVTAILDICIEILRLYILYKSERSIYVRKKKL